MADLTALTHHLDFASTRILCLGDVMLDRFVHGVVDRLSPEAPIPVLKVQSEEGMPGAAGNVVRNVATLGGSAVLVGVIGRDDAGDRLARCLGEQERVEPHLVPCADRRTVVKTRFVAAGQQLLRADRENVLPLEGAAVEKVLAAYRDELGRADVVVLSDYGKGLLSDAVLRPAIDMAVALGKPVIVDPKSRDFTRYRGATLLVPNAAELAAATGMACTTDDEAVGAASGALASGIENLLVTRSMHGMTFVPGSGPPVHLPAQAREVFDVSGAGDTVAATLSVAIASGFRMGDAARLANIAAGIVVGKVGTATVYLDDLRSTIQNEEVSSLSAEIVTRERAVEAAARWRAREFRVGFTNGCFDLIHPGHISLLRQAKAACDRLIVGLNTDASTRRLKGSGRPVQSETARAIVLGSLNAVDLVVPFDEDTPIRLIEAIKPDVLVKGADYTREQVVGADLVTSLGGQVVLARIEQGHSTTRMIADAAANPESPAPESREKSGPVQGPRTTK